MDCHYRAPDQADGSLAPGYLHWAMWTRQSASCHQQETPDGPCESVHYPFCLRICLAPNGRQHHKTCGTVKVNEY